MLTHAKDGAQIAFAQSGHGPPLLLVHGTAADSARWAPVLPALEAAFTVCAMDRRGRGASGDGPRYSLEGEADDVAAAVSALGEPACVLGHSHGAICALEASLRTPRIRKLVLYEPPIPVGAPVFPLDAIDRLQALLDAGDRDGVVSTFFTEIVRIPAAELPALKALPAWPARLAAAHTIPRELRADVSYNFEPARFQAHRTPTLLLLGGDSPPSFKAAIDLLHGALAASQVVVLPQQRHNAINTAPDLFAREVLAFLRG